MRRRCDLVAGQDCRECRYRRCHRGRSLRCFAWNERLLEVLRSLQRADWRRPTACLGWDVLGLAAHLIGGDFSLLSWQRDGHQGTPAPADLDESGFIEWLDDLQMEWVYAARRLSPRLVTDLRAWTDPQVLSLVAAQDPSVVSAHVSWAGPDPVP